MKVDIRFSSRPLETLWTEAIVALVCRGPDISSGPLSGLNEKTIGTLRRLIVSGKWTGDLGEKILIATQNMIMAEKLLLYGLGYASELNDNLLCREMRKAGESIDRIGIRDFGVLIQQTAGMSLKFETYLEKSLKNLMEEFIERHENDSDYHLKIIVFVEDQFMYIICDIIEKLREYFIQIPDLSITYNDRQRSQAA
jgi:hypothetical protein